MRWPHDNVNNNWRKPWLCVCWKRTFLHRSLILNSQQNVTELVTRPVLLPPTTTIMEFHSKVNYSPDDDTYSLSKAARAWYVQGYRVLTLLRSKKKSFKWEDALLCYCQMLSNFLSMRCDVCPQGGPGWKRPFNFVKSTNCNQLREGLLFISF